MSDAGTVDKEVHNPNDCEPLKIHNLLLKDHEHRIMSNTDRIVSLEQRMKNVEDTQKDIKENQKAMDKKLEHIIGQVDILVKTFTDSGTITYMKYGAVVFITAVASAITTAIITGVLR